MNICLKFYGLGIKDIMQAHVIIMSNDKVVYDGFTYNGEVSICIKPCCVYKLYAYSIDEEININFYVDLNRYNYYFYFPRVFIRTITFQLMDLNYSDLMIEKGEIILWQK